MHYIPLNNGITSGSKALDDMLKKNGGYPDYKACEEHVRNHPEILIKDPDR